MMPTVSPMETTNVVFMTIPSAASVDNTDIMTVDSQWYDYNETKHLKTMRIFYGMYYIWYVP